MLKPLRFLAAATAPATVVAAVLTVAASPAGAVSPATNVGEAQRSAAGPQPRTGDNWIGGWLPKILNSPNYTAGDTLVVITWDEGTTADNRVPTIVIAPSVRPSTIVTTPLNHYALLRTTEDIFGLSQLGAAATSPSLATAFGL